MLSLVPLPYLGILTHTQSSIIAKQLQNFKAGAHTSDPLGRRLEAHSHLPRLLVVEARLV